MENHSHGELMNNPTESANFAAILLAAGPSTRLGQPKQLVCVDGESLVRKTVRIIQAQDPVSITVVTGCQGERVEEEIKDLPVRVARNRHWEQGMGGSIAYGARQIAETVDGLLLMVCDQWRLEKQDLASLLRTWRSDISRIYTACWNEGEAFVSAPPVVFPGNLIQELKYVLSNRGARQVIDRNIEIVEFVKMENAAFDLDRPEDLEKLASRS